ncbi:MAG: TonB-dependent siderophore receptor [Sphingomonas adhaesiva]|uniref:TonB-dependent siderophore receptor n=1 Tax=Sphingomonas adhaesiva TaxID=28212 RepID=UPI002FFD12BD
MRAFRSILIAGVAAVAVPALAQAQQAETNAPGEDIVVTGLKRQYFGDTPVKEIPQAVQFLDGDLLKDLNVTRLDTALELASGVSKQNNFGGLWDSFAIRGFAGDENFPSGFLVNGFNGGRGYGGPRDASNVERIEVLKGPNSALFGRGEPGGTINIVTKKPTFKTFGSFAIQGGSFNTFRVEGDYNLPVSDAFAIRVNGAVEDADSFRDTIHTRRYFLTPSMLLKLGEGTIATYEMEYVNQEVPFDRGVVAVNGTLGLIPNSRFLGNPADGPITVKVLGHQLQLQQDLSSDWTLLLGAGYKDTIFRGFSSDPELAAARQQLFVDGRTLSRQRRFRDYSTTHKTVRGEVSGKLATGSVIHNIRIGADWDQFDINSVQQRFRPTLAGNRYAIDIFNPNYNVVAPVPTAALQDNTETQKAWGIYAQDQIELTQAIKVRFGGRYDDFDQSIVNRLATTATGRNPRKSYTRFSPMAGVVVEPTDALSIYASYGRGFRPNSGLGSNDQPFNPELSKAYEVGGKVVTSRITSTLSLFTMQKTNILTNDPFNPGLSRAVGSAESKGIEFDADVKLPMGIQMLAAYSYIDANWTDGLDPSLAIKRGDPLINVPKHQGNLLLFKSFPVADREVTLGAGVNHVGRRLGETGTQFFLPAYTLVRLTGSIEVSPGVKLNADVSNLFNEQYYASSYAALWVQPGAPRAFNVRATFNF